MAANMEATAKMLARLEKIEAERSSGRQPTVAAATVRRETRSTGEEDTIDGGRGGKSNVHLKVRPVRETETTNMETTDRQTASPRKIAAGNEWIAASGGKEKEGRQRERQWGGIWPHLHKRPGKNGRPQSLIAARIQ